jgi:hypothetical protein
MFIQIYNAISGLECLALDEEDVIFELSNLKFVFKNFNSINIEIGKVNFF